MTKYVYSGKEVLKNIDKYIERQNTMTRQEKKEELIGLFSTGAIFIGDLIDEAMDFADMHPHWISVDDELPKEDGFYLCVIGETIQSLFYNDGLEEWYEFYLTKEEHLDCEDLTKKVTHWMPLPAPPKKGGKK